MSCKYLAYYWNQRRGLYQMFLKIMEYFEKNQTQMWDYIKTIEFRNLSHRGICIILTTVLVSEGKRTRGYE